MSNDTQSNSVPLGGRPAFYQRQYIVDKPFQYRLMGTLLAIWLANSVFFSVVLYFFYQGHLLRFYELQPKLGVLPLLSVSSIFTIAIVFVSSFGFVALGIVALYMSNQIAGPLYRMKLSLERVSRGDFGFKLQFRHRDFLRDIPGIFNTMLDGIRQQIESEVEELKGIESAKDLEEAKRLARAMREKKEEQAGQASADSVTDEPEPFSLAVH